MSDQLQSNKLEAQFLKLNEKLRLIWYYEGSIGRLLGDSHTPAVNTYSKIDDQWRDYDKRWEGLMWQAGFFKHIGAIIFFIGSILTGVGRYGELKHRHKNAVVPEP